MTKKIFKITGYVIGALLFLLIVLAGFTQSKLFKDRLRVFLISEVGTNTNASFSLGAIRGNLFTGFVIDSLELSIGGEKFLRTGKIALTYNPFSLPRQTLSFLRITVENPEVVLKRGGDGVWNIDKLGKPPESQEPSSFDWTIRIRKLNVLNGNVIVYDSLSLASPGHPETFPHQVEYHDFSLFNLSLECSGIFKLNDARLSITNLSFE